MDNHGTAQLVKSIDPAPTASKSIPQHATTYRPANVGAPEQLAKAPSPPPRQGLAASTHQLINAGAFGFLVGFSVCLALVCYRRRRTHAA